MPADGGPVRQDSAEQREDDWIDRLIIADLGKEHDHGTERQQEHQDEPQHFRETAVAEKLPHDCTSLDEKVIDVERHFGVEIAECKHHWIASLRCNDRHEWSREAHEQGHKNGTCKLSNGIIEGTTPAVE